MPPALVGVVAQQSAQHLDHRQRQPRPAHQRGVGTLGDIRLDQLVLAHLRHRIAAAEQHQDQHPRSEEHTSELQSLMRISYAVFCLKKKKYKTNYSYKPHTTK